MVDLQKQGCLPVLYSNTNIYTPHGLYPHTELHRGAHTTELFVGYSTTLQGELG
uniref:Uncharacterized protein n=1 Tax=Anguilla anguilla TaxID=7936 RepID=A0A0E9QSF7_ANGAN